MITGRVADSPFYPPQNGGELVYAHLDGRTTTTVAGVNNVEANTDWTFPHFSRIDRAVLRAQCEFVLQQLNETP
jgi:hypothetical protein